jgi:hypothetical protein
MDLINGNSDKYHQIQMLNIEKNKKIDLSPLKNKAK